MSKTKNYNDLIKKAGEVAVNKEISPLCFVGAVGCALITRKNNTYIGSSIECACAIGGCAEYTAIASMLMNGESKIKTIVAVGSDGSILPPCGRCRETMFQINKDNLNTEIIIGKNKSKKLKELLPDVWFKK